MFFTALLRPNRKIGLPLFRLSAILGPMAAIDILLRWSKTDSLFGSQTQPVRNSQDRRSEGSSRQRRDMSIEIRCRDPRTPAECYVKSYLLAVNVFFGELSFRTQTHRKIEISLKGRHEQSSFIMDVPEILSRFVPSFDTLFLGVKSTEPEVLTEAGHPLGWLLSVLQKEDVEDTSEISEALLAAVSHLGAVDEAFSPQVAEAFRYFVQLIYHRRSVDERDALIGIIRDHIEDKEVLETMAQTTAELLMEQGEARGLVKGKVEGKQDAVLKILRIRFPDVSDTLLHKIAEIRSVPKLDALLEQAMIADSPEEVEKET